MPNVASTALKDKSHLTCFTSDKKNHNCPEPKKDRDTSEDQRHLRRLYLQRLLSNEFREQVPCIRYPTTFREESVSALLNSGSEVNAIHPTFAKELGLPIRPTDVGAQKSTASRYL